MIGIDPRAPTRGQSAFQTDVCIFETRDEIAIPRVVLEFKQGLSTHDVLTYSTKARKHKQVYPYLRYGLVSSEERNVPNRFFLHNEALDFCATLKSLSKQRIRKVLADLVTAEITASRTLELMSLGEANAHLFRTDVQLGSSDPKAIEDAAIG